ncbi:MAG: alpha/beta hydrolase [Nocardioides sp.]|nr:alpha/beta hydrolase [Nocardioides sp.]
MSIRNRIIGVAAGALGVAVAGTAAEVARRRRVVARRGRGTVLRLGSLHSSPVTVIADDGVPLHAEIDEYDAPAGERRRETGSEPADELTVVFVHGYALNLDCWHFQRAGYRGLVRSVYFDQRSHGRSGRSPDGHATIDQLGVDLLQVIEQVAPEGRVVLVGHSMGGMSIISLAEQHPELFGDRIVGVGLISTTAGGMSTQRIVLPLLPEGIGGQLMHRAIAGLARTSRVVEGVRRASKDVATVATDKFAFGEDAPGEYVAFVDRMLSATPFDVLAEFFPQFDSLDKFSVISAFERVPTTIICGTADRLTSIGHSRKLHSLIPGSTLVECEGAGHMVIMEQHERVNAALDQLLAAAAAHVPNGPE